MARRQVVMQQGNAASSKKTITGPSGAVEYHLQAYKLKGFVVVSDSEEECDPEDRFFHNIVDEDQPLPT